MVLHTNNWQLLATMNISMPAPMRDWVQEQIADGRYASSSDYVRDLIRQDQTKVDKVHALQEAITKGLESGIGSKSMDDILAEVRSMAEQGILRKDRNGN